jgi:hypothetical protein
VPARSQRDPSTPSNTLLAVGVPRRVLGAPPPKLFKILPRYLKQDIKGGSLHSPYRVYHREALAS